MNTSSVETLKLIMDFPQWSRNETKRNKALQAKSMQISFSFLEPSPEAGHSRPQRPRSFWSVTEISVINQKDRGLWGREWDFPSLSPVPCLSRSFKHPGFLVFQQKWRLIMVSFLEAFCKTNFQGYYECSARHVLAPDKENLLQHECALYKSHEKW